MLHMIPRLALHSMMVIIGNILLVAVNERTGGFSSPRHRFIGLAYECLLVTLIPLCTVSDFEVDAFWIVIVVLSLIDFGNSRELSLRWMVHGAAQTGPLRWLQAFSRHLHHHALAVGGVLLLYHSSEESYRWTAALILYFNFCTHSCQTVIRLRFKTLARRLPGLIAVLALACICLLWFQDSNGPLELRCLGIAAFTGTLLNAILNYFGPYVKSKSEASTEIRGKSRRCSIGGADYEARLTAKVSYSGKALDLGELPEHLADANPTFTARRLSMSMDCALDLDVEDGEEDEEAPAEAKSKGDSWEDPTSIDDSVDLDAQDEEAPGEPVVPTLLGLQPAEEIQDDVEHLKV